MSVKDTLKWAKTEWGIFAKRDQLTARESLRWLSQWVPFGLRTIAYGTISLTIGPLTPDFAASSWAQKRWSRASAKALRIRVETSGTELVPPGGVLYASNHQSLLDILVLGAVLPGDLKWATKRAIMRVPFLGWHLSLAGHVPVDRRSGKASAEGTIGRFVDVLEAGKPLLVFPEGTRSRDDAVRPFKNGAFYAAVRSGKPVLPVAIEGTHALMAKHSVDAGEVRGAAAAGRLVRVRIGPPLYAAAAGDELSKVEALREATRDVVVSMYAQLRQQAKK